MLNILMTGDIYFPATQTPCLDPALQRLFESHYVIGNLEAPLIEIPSPSQKAGPILSMGINTAKTLSHMGINAVSLANNHSMDHGPEGLRSTTEALTSHAIAHIGIGFKKDPITPLILEEHQTVIFAAAERDFGAAVDHPMHIGYAWIGDPELDRAIDTWKQKNFTVLVIAHAGEEYTPLPLPLWQARYRHLCDVGASAVIGHHPHVPQPIEKYKESSIVYSLGNFFFHGRDGLGLLSELNIRNGHCECRIIPIVQRDNNLSTHPNTEGVTKALAQIWNTACKNTSLFDAQTHHCYAENIEPLISVLGLIQKNTPIGKAILKTALNPIIKRPLINLDILVHLTRNESHNAIISDFFGKTKDISEEQKKTFLELLAQSKKIWSGL